MSSELVPAYNASASTCPAQSRVGITSLYRSTVVPSGSRATSSVSPGRAPGEGAPAVSHARTVLFRRTRWGAPSHPLSKISP